jgi:hypothetical protein
MISHGADMARGAPRRNHRRIAQGRAAFQVDGDDILGLVVVQRGQDSLQQIALRRGFSCLLARLRRGSSRRLARRLLRGLFEAGFGGLFGGFFRRDFFYGFRGFRLCGGFFGGFASQG